MKSHYFLSIMVIMLVSVFGLATGSAQSMQDMPSGNPNAAVDLTTIEGAQLVKGEWRYSDAKIIEVDFKSPGSDGQPTGKPIKTYD